MNKQLLIIFFYLSSYLIVQAQVGNDSLNFVTSPEISLENGIVSLRLTQNFIKQDKDKEAFNQLQITSGIFEELENDSGIAVCFELEGDIYAGLSAFDKSIECYFNAIDLFLNLDEEFKVHQLEVKVGSVELRVGNIESSKKYLFKALKYFIANDYQNDIFNVHYKLGIINGNLNRMDSALFYFDWCAKMYEDLNLDNTAQHGGIHNNIGAIHSKNNDYDLAKESYLKAMDIFVSDDNLLGMGVSYSNLAFLSQKQNKFHEALPLYDSSIFYLEQSKGLWYLESIYANLSELHDSLSNSDKSLWYFKKYISIKDSIEGYEVVDKIYQIETRYEIEQQNKELELLETENRSKSRIQWLLMILILMLLGLAFVIIRLMKTKINNTVLKHQMLSQERDVLHKELKYKNKELEDFALRIIEKNRFLEELNTELKDIKIGKDESNSSKLKEVISNIRGILYIDQDRRNFEDRLDGIHQAFLHKLMEKIPNLSKAEKRLCSLLVMNLSTKDMATILNISLQGVKTARHRLRKKLNLSQEEDLANFLNSL